MMINLSLSIGAMAQGLSSPDVVLDMRHTATVTELSRDMAVFDSDMMRGNDNAAVRLSGSTTAPDGGVIEARAVSVDDGGATTTAWRPVSTAAGGAWSGVLDTPRSTSWYRAEVRVQGSTAPAARMSNRFGVGLVLYHHRQSNGTRLYGMFGEAPVPDLSGIAANFQVTRVSDDAGSTWAGNPDNRIIRGPDTVTTAAPVTTALGAMAEVFHRNAPGLKVHLLADVRAGESVYTTLTDSATKRSFAKTQQLIAAGTADGQDVGAFIFDHWNGLESLSNVENVLYGNINLDHAFVDVMPGLATGRTQIIFGGSGDFYSSASLPSSGDAWRTIARAFIAAFPSRAKRLYDWPMASCMDNPDPTSVANGNHWNTFGPDAIYGASLYASGRAATILQAAGKLPTAPGVEAFVFDNVEVDPAGAHVTIWSSAGPVTTIERQQALLESRAPVNLPFTPAEGTPGNAEVMGFQFTDFTMPRRVEIVDEFGNPASSGRLRVYPDSGTFNASSGLFQGIGHSGRNWFNDGWSRLQYSREYLVQRHFPIIDIGLEGRLVEHGMYVGPNPNPQWINEAITAAFPASDYRFQFVPASRALPIGYFDEPSGLTLHARLAIQSGGVTLFRNGLGSDFMNIRVFNDEIRLSARSGGLTTLFNYTVKAPIPKYADGTMELLINVNAGARRLEIYTRSEDGGAWTPFDPDGIWFDNSAFNGTDSFIGQYSTYTAFESPWNGSTSFDFLRIWEGGRNGAGVPGTTPWRAVEADEAGGIDASVALSAASSGRFDVLENGSPR